MDNNASLQNSQVKETNMTMNSLQKTSNYSQVLADPNPILANYTSKNSYDFQTEQYHDILHFLGYLGYQVGDVVIGIVVKKGEPATIWTGILGQDNFTEFWKLYETKNAKKGGYFEKNFNENKGFSNINQNGFFDETETHFFVKKYKDGMSFLNHENQKNDRNVFFKPNGCINELSCKKVVANFYEIDDKNKTFEQQRNESLEHKIKPQLILFSGNKSNHTYYLLREEDQTEFEKWKQGQSKIIDSKNSDSSIKDFSRNLRLPTFLHPKTKQIATYEFFDFENYKIDDILENFGTKETTLFDVENKNNSEQEKNNSTEKQKFVKNKERLPKSIKNLSPTEYLELVESALDCIPERQAGQGLKGKTRDRYGNIVMHYDELLSVMIGLYTDFDDDETVVELMHKHFGNDEDWRTKLESIYNRTPKDRPTIGTVFYIAKAYGFEFPKQDHLGDLQIDEYFVSKNTTIETCVLEILFSDEFCVINEAFYKYNQKFGYWEHKPETFVKKIIASELPNFYKIKDKEKYYTFANSATISSCFIFAKNYLTINFECSNQHLIAFKNGTLNLKTGELENHSKDNYLLNAVPVDFNKAEKMPPVFESFILNSFGKNQVNLIRACISMLIDPTASYGKFVHILGESGSGKGTLIRLIKMLKGEKQVRSLSDFSILSDQDKRHQNLTGISLATAPDCAGFQKSLQAFYELVDNGSMSGRALNSSDGYEKQWNVRFIMASVNHLQIENAGEGWKRRCIPIVTKPRKNKENPNLGYELSQELGQIAGWALSMDKNERHNLLFSPELWSKEAKDAQNQADVFSDSVRAFIDSCLTFADDSEHTITVNDLFDYYKGYCKVANFKSYSRNKFKQHFRQVLGDFFLESSVVKNPETKKAERLPARYQNIMLADPQLFKFDVGNQLICDQKRLIDGGYDELQKISMIRRLGGVTDVTSVTDAQNPDYEGSSVVTTMVTKTDLEDVTDPKLVTSDLDSVTKTEAVTKTESENVTKDVTNETLTQSELEDTGYSGYKVTPSKQSIEKNKTPNDNATTENDYINQDFIMENGFNIEAANDLISKIHDGTLKQNLNVWTYGNQRYDVTLNDDGIITSIQIDDLDI